MKSFKMGLLYFAVISVLIVVFILWTDSAMAQPGLPSDPEQTPIDGGLGILAALGGSYAIKKLREKNKV